MQPDQRARRLFAGGGKARGVSAPLRRAVVGGPRYGGKFTNTEDPDFQLFDSHELASQHATDQAQAWRDNGANEAGAFARLTAEHQAKPSVYLAPGEIGALTLDEFDRHAHEQADWMTGTAAVTGAALFSDDQKQEYRDLLGLARKDKGRILAACGRFGVGALLELGVGPPGVQSRRFDAYAKAVAGVGLTRIESPAATAAEADQWGWALLALGKSPKLTRDVASKVIPQRPKVRTLKRLVDQKAVPAFVDYVNSVEGIVLHATNGAEVISFCEFLAEGGDVKAYAELRPELRHVHRYTRGCLDLLLDHRAEPRGLKPLTVVMQTALDHNGASYRNDNITNLVKRPDRVTVIVESLGTLADFNEAAETVAARHKTDGKVDEILITGHGGAQSMGLAATKQRGRYQSAKEDVALHDSLVHLGHALDHVDGSRATFRAVLQHCTEVTDTSELPLDNDQALKRLNTAMEEDKTVSRKLRAALAGMDGLPAVDLNPATRAFVDRLMAIMLDDAEVSRIVLHSCLTASNRALVNVDSNQSADAQQAAIKSALAKNPSLATRIKEQLPNRYADDVNGLGEKKGVSVLGANASVAGRKTDLHEPLTGRISMTNSDDPQLTAPDKLDYARHGTEPEGALRAAVEAWADNRATAIKALTDRVADPVIETWRERVIRALYARSIANPDDGALLIALERASGALAGLVRPDKASVASLRAVVPGAHAAEIFEGLLGAEVLAEPTSWFTAFVMYQVWIATDATRHTPLLDALNIGATKAGVTSQSVAKYLDFDGLAPSLGTLLPVPGAVKEIRYGRTVLALAYVVKLGGAAPAAALAYLRALLDLREVDGRVFPDRARIPNLLRGATTSDILSPK